MREAAFFTLRDVAEIASLSAFVTMIALAAHAFGA